MRKFNAIKNAINFGKGKKMNEPNGYRFRVYKLNKNDGMYDAFYNDTTLYGCVEYMERWNGKTSSHINDWYIIDEDNGYKFEMNSFNELVMMGKSI